MRLRHTVRLTQPEGHRAIVVDCVIPAFEPGFYCGVDVEHRDTWIKYHYQDILKTERVDEEGKVVETLDASKAQG